MMRSLWTAASGMTAQQTNVDTISNNLANVNTVGYKKETTNFKSLLYTKMGNQAETNAPTSMQVGHGVRIGSNSRMYTQGTIQTTGNPTDMAIEGKGFFTVVQDDEYMYTRDGNFRMAMLDDGNYALVTTDGHPVISIDEEPIIVDGGIGVDKLIVGQDGMISYMDEETGIRMDIAQLRIVQFSNKEGLEAAGSNMFMETAASGVARVEGEEDGLTRSIIKSGVLEGSNVDVANEMVNLIVAQRAYELNSTAIKTADTMLQQANELKRG